MPDMPEHGRTADRDEFNRSLKEAAPLDTDGVKPTPFRFSLRTLMLATTAIALALFGIQLGWQRARANFIEQEIQNHFKQIELGLSNYCSVYETLPSANGTNNRRQSFSSWRFGIFPYTESWDVPRDMRAAWNAPANSSVRALPFDCFCWKESDSNTNVFAIIGSGTAFDIENRVGMSDVSPNLVLLMEVADSKTHWMQPGDYDVKKLLAATGRLGDAVKGLLPDRIHILFANSEVWALSPDMPIDALKPFLTIAAAKTADRDKQLAPYRVND